MEMQPPYRKPLIFSLALHVIVFLVLAMGFEWHGTNYIFEKSNTQQIINAVAMSSVAALKPAPHTPPVASTPPPVATTPPRVIPVLKPKVDEKAIALNAKKQLQKTDDIQKQLLKDLHKQKQVQTKLKQKQLENDFQNEIKNLSAKSLQQQMKKETLRADADREQQAQGQVDKYKALILQAIGRHWLIPSNVDKRLAVNIVIYVAPGGMVLDAEIDRSSGDTALDNSARAAVFKASPLPVPTDADGFKFFRRFVLVFKPMYFQQGEFN